MLEVAAGRLRGGLVRGFFAFGGAVDMIWERGAAGVYCDYCTGKEMRPGRCLRRSGVE